MGDRSPLSWLANTHLLELSVGGRAVARFAFLFFQESKNILSIHYYYLQAGLYGVYAEVSYFRTWIEQTMLAYGGAVLCA